MSPDQSDLCPPGERRNAWSGVDCREACRPAFRRWQGTDMRFRLMSCDRKGPDRPTNRSTAASVRTVSDGPSNSPVVTERGFGSDGMRCHDRVDQWRTYVR